MGRTTGRNEAIKEAAIKSLAEKGAFQTKELGRLLCVQADVAFKALRKSKLVTCLGTKSMNARGRPPMWWGFKGTQIPGVPCKGAASFKAPSHKVFCDKHVPEVAQSSKMDPVTLEGILDVFVIPVLLKEGIQYTDRLGKTWVFSARVIERVKPQPVITKLEALAVPSEVGRKQRVRLTPAQRREAQALLKEGKLTQQEIAERFGVVTSTICRLRRPRKSKSQKVVKVNFQDRRRRGNSRLLSEETKAKIRALLKKGHKIDRVAKKTGHTWRTVKALA